ncbi:glycosyltransferase [Neisseriaceae bacterium JH1-16]|nr:glycosyltransferase [Neisseriaceae bacterium JH1-16]
MAARISIAKWPGRTRRLAHRAQGARGLFAASFGQRHGGYTAPMAHWATPHAGSAWPSFPGVGVKTTPSAEPPLLVPLLSGKQRWVFALLCAGWAISLAVFWVWWLRPEHNIDTFRFIANTVVLFWTTIIPAYFVTVFARARIANPARPVPPGMKVAMVVTKAPSEPFELVRTTLEAMLAQSYPHDTWLADEDPSDETIDWCAQHGVFLSSRRGVAAYHNTSWPRRTKCKEGNLAYFYDHYGYGRYDVVSQLDADHVPAPGYLEAMLRPFADPRVGYVSAPSICDSNAKDSWSARGRLYAEAALHGALQVGYNGGMAPLCIGSHYAVRLNALREIGGLGPELAEDHSTTLMMNAKGWRGIHAIDAIAHGEGPRTFADMATQEFQWAKSLVVILLRYTRQYLSPLPWRLKAQFLFSQFWYPLFSLTMAASVIMPVVALFTHRAWVDIAYTSYFLYASLVTVSILALMTWVRKTGYFRPHDAKVLSWEALLFHFARWPWSLLGVGSAVVDWLRGREFDFRVTPKTDRGDARAPLRVLLPYLVLSLFCIAPVLLVGHAGNARGFYLLSMFNCLTYLTIAVLIVVKHARERGLALPAPRLLFGQGPLLQRGLFVTTALALVVGLTTRLSTGMEGVLWRSGGAPLLIADQQREPLALGVYDPSKAFSANDKQVKIEHIFVSWVDPNARARIVAAADYAQRRHRQLMVTVEPWPEVGRSAPALLKDVRRGAYDPEIRSLCDTMNSLAAAPMVRWAHEMESPTGRYPWATHDPASYVGAYKHFVDQCRTPSSRLQFVWSPRGDPALPAYFPGRDYVDYVGLSVFDCPECGVQPAGDQHSAASILQEKYRRVYRYQRPVIVAELGVNGSVERRREALQDLQETAGKLPLLTSLVYFNAKDSNGAWPVPYPPDWRIAPQLFRQALSEQ